MRRSAVMAGFGLLAMFTGFADARPTVSLDGTWQFRFAPDDRGEKETWFRPDVEYSGNLQVPGCWDAQGIGEPTDKVRHNAVGVGWHRRTFALPVDWAGRRVWLRVGGAHRSAKIWVNAQPVGEHWGYPVAFQFDITGLLSSGRDQSVVLAVDSRRHKERDTLTGAFDIIDCMDVDWGGIFDSVTLHVTDQIWLDDVFVQPDPAAGRARVQVDLGRTGQASLDSLTVRFGVKRWTADGADSPALQTGEVSAAGKQRIEWDLKLPDAPLWTPETPNLLKLDLVLLRGPAAVDEQSVRFGQRHLEIRGNDFYLNGERFFLRGYGDDFTFPKEITPPPSVEYWRRYLSRRKEFGLMGVRHHSTMMPETYLAAADEVGVLVQPELPIAYEPFYKAATPAGHDLYRHVWRNYIRQMRNHPSVFSWCMGNEQWAGFGLGPELYKTAKELDPTRPVIDTDGSPWNDNRPSLDYISYMFDVFNVPWGVHRNLYRLPAPAQKPIISHETSNDSVLPDPADIPKYDGIIKPFWIEQMAEQVRARGLGEYLDRMLSASRRLQATLIKLNIEGARLSPEVDGHHQWLFRDYWTQSTGIVNQFDETRALTPEMARQFFGQAVVLWDHDRVNYRAGESIPLAMFVSDFRPKAAAPALAEVSVSMDKQTLTLKAPDGAGGRGLIGPWTGQFTAPAVTFPQKFVVKAQTGPVTDEWPVWVFPAPSSEKPAAGKQGGVLRTRWLTKSALDRLASGGAVWLLDEEAIFPTLRGRFKSAWWKGDDSSDSCYGNMILSHPALGAFPHDGYGDLQMAGMLDDRLVVLTDELPGRPEPIVWCLDVPWQMRRKAYLFEAKVGNGRLLVSTLNLSRKQRETDPAAEWLFNQLTGYVQGSEFRPKAELPMDWLRSRVGGFVPPDPAGWVEGFAKMLENTEPPAEWLSYCEDRTASYPVRQTDGRQKLRWVTAVVPKDWAAQTVTFVWAGGIGWRTEPDAGNFDLALDGRALVEFPFVQKSTRWTTKDGTVQLQYLVRRSTDQDSLGLFFLTVPVSRIAPGKAAEITVTAKGKNSKRWFGLNPYTNLRTRESQDF